MNGEYDAEADSFGSWRVAIDVLRERHLRQTEQQNDSDDWRAVRKVVGEIAMLVAKSFGRWRQNG